jgi:hypothetical protein
MKYSLNHESNKHKKCKDMKALSSCDSFYIAIRRLKLLTMLTQCQKLCNVG